MPFYKLLGTALLLLCGAGVGTLLWSTERRRHRQAEGFLTLVRHIRTQIDHFARPIGDIIADCDEKLQHDCGFLRSACDFSELLASCELCVPREIREALEELSQRLGGGYRKSQLQCCDDCIARLAPCCERLRASRAAREKTAMLLPLLLAACLALLLW